MKNTHYLSGHRYYLKYLPSPKDQPIKVSLQAKEEYSGQSMDDMNNLNMMPRNINSPFSLVWVLLKAELYSQEPTFCTFSVPATQHNKEV